MLKFDTKISNLKYKQIVINAHKTCRKRRIGHGIWSMFKPIQNDQAKRKEVIVT
jgi:hypothetical protein